IDSHGHTPLFYAACLGDLQSVKALLEKGADVNTNNSMALLSAIPTRPDSATGNVSEQIFRLFIDKGVKVPAQAIITASAGQNLAVLNELLSRNADIKAKDTDGNTALHYATWGSETPVEVIQILLEKGADPNAE